jgi:sporulation protein YtfJ
MEISKQSELINSSLEQIKGLFDSDMVLGKPIDLKNGSFAIPVSKINLGVASGGVDYLGKYHTSTSNFGGGGGTGVSIEPIGFLVSHQHGTVELLDFNKAPKDIFARVFDLIEHSPELFDKFKSIFANQN